MHRQLSCRSKMLFRIAAVASALSLLAACAGSSSSSGASATQSSTSLTRASVPSTTTTVDPSDVIDQAAAYLRFIRQALEQNGYSSALLDDLEVERDLAMAGLTICDVFSAGSMVDLVAPSLTGDRQLDSLLYFAMVASAVTNFCPENEDSLGRFIVDYSP